MKHSFVRVGFYLRKVRDEKLYLQDGYSSLSEFAKAEFNMGASFVSRMISINEKFSLDGYSEQMDPRYEDFRQGALTEMLALPDSDMEMVTPATPREDIRELKRFNAQDPVPEQAGDEHGKLLEVVEDFCRQDRQLIDDLYEYTSLASTAERDLIEMINPSGSRTFKKGLYFISFTDTAVKVKKFMQPPQDMSYQQFVGMIAEILGSAKTGHNWEDHFGLPESDQKQPENDRKPAKSDQISAKSDQIRGKSDQTKEKLHEEKRTEDKAGTGRKDAGGDDQGSTEAGGEGAAAAEGSRETTDHSRYSPEDQDQDAGGQDRPDRGETGGHDQDEPSGNKPEETAGESAAAEQEETQVEALAPAQLEESQIPGMNLPEDAGGYDMAVINGLLTALEDSIENKNWLTAELKCNELAAYLARCRGGEACS